MEALTSIPATIVQKIVDKLFDATVHHFSYWWSYKEYIDGLKKEVDKLANVRHDLQAKVDAAERNGEIIKHQIGSWIAKVDKIISETQKFLEDEAKASKKCFDVGGSRYKISKEAGQKTSEISDLIVDGNFGEDVSLPTPPPPIVCFSEGFYTFSSRESIMKEIIETATDKNVRIVGICGMGGVGKTTLVKKIQKQAKEMKIFDEVAMAVVSQTPSITNIQNEIACWLGFKKLPSENDPTRASSLKSRIEKGRRVLIILDDIWKKIELSEVGIPYGKDYGGCTILLTSRSRAACNQMNADKIIDVGALTKEESWTLFSYVAGSKADETEINPTAREVADRCGGLPIAILTVAAALKDKDRDVWEDAAEQLKNSTPTVIEGVDEFVISRVELSYNYLKDEEVKSIFRLCSCFPEDYSIEIKVLAKYAVGLMCFQNIDSLEKAKRRAHSSVSALIFSYLLIDGDKENEVKMHDIVRYVGQQIASQNKFMIRAGVGIKDWPNRDTYQDLKGISLMYNDIDEIPDQLESPNLQALFLQNNSFTMIPINFFRGLNDIKVLDLSYNKFLSLPSSLSCVCNLRTLLLRGCEFGDGLSVIGELSRLEILDLSRSNVSEIPISFGQLSQLRLLDLTDCEELTTIPQGVIPRLRKLEVLYMNDTFVWGSDKNAAVVELQALSRLSSLRICIPKGTVLPSDPQLFTNLTRFFITTGVLDEFDFFIDTLDGASDYCYDLLGKLSHNISRIMMVSFDMGTSMKNLLPRTEGLGLTELNGLNNVVPDLVDQGLKELKSLFLNRCQEMKFLMDTSLESKRTPRVPSLHKLELLIIISNPSFIEICHGDQLPTDCFKNVKCLVLVKCHSMLNIFSTHLLPHFKSLELLAASNCSSLAYAFEFEGSEILKNEGRVELLSSLQEVHLRKLPHMSQIWKGDIQFVSLQNLKRVTLMKCCQLTQVFPPILIQSLIRLEKLRVTKCDNLKEIFGSKVGGAGNVTDIEARSSTSSINPTLSQAMGRNLLSVKIQGCKNLRKLFTASMVEMLARLESLKVYRCPALLEIIITDDDEVGVGSSSTRKIIFSNLSKLILRDLESLTCFSSHPYASVEFPDLEILEIAGCPSMKTFGYGDQTTPKLTNPTFDGGYPWAGNLNDAVRRIFNENQWTEAGKQSETTSSSSDEEEEELEAVGLTETTSSSSDEEEEELEAVGLTETTSSSSDEEEEELDAVGLIETNSSSDSEKEATTEEAEG